MSPCAIFYGGPTEGILRSVCFLALHCSKLTNDALDKVSAPYYWNLQRFLTEPDQTSSSSPSPKKTSQEGEDHVLNILTSPFSCFSATSLENRLILTIKGHINEVICGQNLSPPIPTRVVCQQPGPFHWGWGLSCQTSPCNSPH